MWNSLFSLQNFAVIFTLLPFHTPFSVAEEFAPVQPVPFHNLIPRFKMPRGNLLRYNIPQWEVLYFLKYGIVPFIFYDPNFNRTHFIAKVHKFKTYFEPDGRPNRTSKLELKDDESFKKFLLEHGYPNHNKLPENALSRNNKVAAEINLLLRAASEESANVVEPPNILGQDGTSEDQILKDVESKLGQPDFVRPGGSDLPDGRAYSIETSDKRTTSKRTDLAEINRYYFWNLLANKYRLSLSPTSLVGSSAGFLLDHNLIGGRSPLRASGTSSKGSTKTFRIGLRNVEMNRASAEPDDVPSDSGDARKGSKNFQTQGW